MEISNQPKRLDADAKAAENNLQKEKITKIIIWVSVIIVAIVIIIFIFVASKNHAVQAGNDAIGQADVTIILQRNDSLALVQYSQIAATYGQDAGNRAKLMAAILLYKKGEYQKALDQLKSYDRKGAIIRKEAIISAGSYSLEGDCYVNLNKYDDALKCYDKAISKSDDNPAYTPFFIAKKARIYHEQNNFEKEYEAYSIIKKDYPEYFNNLGFEKYLERAKSEAGK